MKSSPSCADSDAECCKCSSMWLGQNQPVSMEKPLVADMSLDQAPNRSSISHALSIFMPFI